MPLLYMLRDFLRAGPWLPSNSTVQYGTALDTEADETKALRRNDSANGLPC